MSNLKKYHIANPVKVIGLKIIMNEHNKTDTRVDSIFSSFMKM